MKATIGQKLIASLIPKDRPYEVRDSRLKGFLVRIQPSGVKTFICEYGRGRRIVIGSTEVFKAEKARTKATTILGQVADGLDPMAEKRKLLSCTFEDFVKNEYIPILTHRRRPKEVENRLLRSFPQLKNVKLGKITARQVEKWRAARKNSGVAASTVNRELAELKAALSKAVELEWLNDHPLQGVKLEKLDSNPIIRYLSEEEEVRLGTSLENRTTKQKSARESANNWRRQRGYPEMPSDPHDHLQPMILLAMNTGLRRGELFELKWEDVDLDRALRTVHGIHTKSL